MVNFQKIKQKVENKVLSKLGSTLTINKYTVTFNDYQEETLTLSTTSNVKAIEITANDTEFNPLNSVVLSNSQIMVLIPADTIVKPTTKAEKYEFVFYSKTYFLNREMPIGRLQDISNGVIKQIVLDEKRE